MKKYRFADLTMEIVCTYEYTKKLCKEYEVAEDEPADLSIKVTESDIEWEQEKADQTYPKAYLESLNLYRKIGEQAINYDVLLMHGSVVEVDGRAYIFTAPSGTGKSTHTKLWMEYFKERARMINDDKPLIRFFDDEIKAYGTPWDGKHRLSTNSSAPVQSICILAQGKENRIEKISKQKAWYSLLGQVYRINDAKKMEKVMKLLDRLVTDIPVFKMECNISTDAVITAYEAMKPV